MRWLHCMSACMALGTLLFAGLQGGQKEPLSSDLVLEDSSILEMDEPIDVVYTWENRADRKWKAARNKYLKKNKVALKEAKQTPQFRSHDELKYSLRSIYAYAPFVRHIFIVTSGKRPKWLAKHPKITFVRHKSIFSNKKLLPIFNPVAIVANLHRIPELANRYLYFTDEIFLGKKVSREDFFERPYKIKVFLTEEKVFDGSEQVQKDLNTTISQNMGLYLEEETSLASVKQPKEGGLYHARTPLPMIKWIAELTKKRFRLAYNECTSSKFQSNKDMSFVNGLIPFYALHQDVGVSVKADSITVPFVGNPDKDKAELAVILAKKPMFFCIQNAEVTCNKVSEKALKTFFKIYYPKPAPWEKSHKKKKHK